MIRILVPLALVLLVLFGPQLWAARTLKRHAGRRADLSITGGELARKLLDDMGMKDVAVEETAEGDHYDPVGKAVRLTPAVHGEKSLTALVVAAHEVGHSMQDCAGYRPLHLRTRLVESTRVIEKLGPILLMLLPIVGALTRAPSVAGLMLAAGLATLGAPVLVHLVTLPVEWDASFRRALPVLARGHVPRPDLPAAREILTACALTYVAGALASLLNFWRWLAILRR